MPVLQKKKNSPAVPVRLPGLIRWVIKQLFFKENSCSANEFGAIPDGKTLNTGAIQNAIDACSKNGEGSVTFQKGIYLTGSLFIKEGIHFKIDKDVEIRGSQDIKDYKQIDTRIAGIEMKWPAALTNVQNRKNVIVDGEGIINGQGKVCFGIVTGISASNTNLKDWLNCKD